MTAFNDHVLAWLRSEGEAPGAAEVAHVSGDGSDWNGGTEEGFYSDFSVEIRYVDGAGKERSRTVRGDDMESPWKSVVGGWGASE